MNVVVVPGFMGSELVGTAGPFRQTVWLNYVVLASGGLTLLRLNAAGDGPAVGLPFTTWSSGQPLASYYGGLVAFLRDGGHDARGWGYDWRMSVRSQGQALSGFLEGAWPGQDVYLLGHSMGGLVCRAAWKVRAGSTATWRPRRLVTLGTPHYGSLSFLRVFARLDATYLALSALIGALRSAGPLSGFFEIDPVLTSWVAPYELLPWRNYGPLAGVPHQGDAVYSSSTYLAYQPLVRQARLDGVQAAQAWLSDAGDPSLTVSVLGTEILTATAIDRTDRLGTPLGYLYSPLGDGQVPVSYGTWAGARTLFAPGVRHAALPYTPSVVARLEALLRDG